MNDVILPVLGEALPFIALIGLVVLIRWAYDRGVECFDAWSDRPRRWK
jgi:hypothetical protein